MTMTPTAVRAARRNLVQRIERFVRRVETDGWQPGVDAIANVEAALDCLEREDYAGGEDAMLCGEHGFAPRFPRPAETPPIGTLIGRFRRLVAEGQ